VRACPLRPLIRCGFALVLTLLSTQAARGQEVVNDGSSLARYIPRENLGIYVEYRGLDSQPEAWKKTATYKILNETPTGALIEEVTTQLIEKTVGMLKPNPRQFADQAVAITKHLARSGFVFGVAKPDESKKAAAILVLRDAFKDKAIRSIMAGYLQGLNAPNTKPTAVERVGHKVITGTDSRGKKFTWWVDDTKKEDILLMFEPPEQADVFLETIEGKRPNALEHPRRQELSKPEGRFVPTGLAFIGAEALAEIPNRESLGLSNVKAFDFRWGFEDEVLMTSLRIATTGPRKGLLALLDGSTFEKAKIPPISENATGLTVASFDLPATFDRLEALAKAMQPGSEDQFKSMVDWCKEKAKLRLKEDILAQVGPKMAFYTLPARKASSPSGLTNLLTSSLDVPKLALVFEIRDPASVGKSLDQLMAAVNRELKTVGKPPVETPARGSRGRSASGPSVEFRLTPGESKGYVLSVPQEMASTIPATVRPTIRIGPKHLIIAISPEVARFASEAKAGWTPAKEMAKAADGLSTNLKLLIVTDPRNTLPELLAALPGKIQQLAGAASLARMLQPGQGGAPAQPPAVANPPALVLQVDAAKLPSADSIKALLFPSLFTVEATPDEIRLVSRDAFPSIGDPSGAVTQLSIFLPLLQSLRTGQPMQAPAPGTAQVPNQPAGNVPGGAPTAPSGGVPRAGSPAAGAGNRPIGASPAVGGGAATTRPD